MQKLIDDNNRVSDRWQQNNFYSSLPAFPKTYSGPKVLFHEAWVEFASRLETDREIQLLLTSLKGSKNILDIGGGTGLLTTSIASQYGKCTVVEPDPDNAACIDTDKNIDIVLGKGEELPCPDNSFDAIVATWVLQYTSSPIACIEEMVRVCTKTLGSRIAIVQAAPWNEVALLLNACAELVGKPISHHGYLLATAASILEKNGFKNIEMQSVSVEAKFPEATAAERISAATSLLQRMCYQDHPNTEEIHQLLEEKLQNILQEKQTINDDGILLLAKWD
jgi:ubiquinone/menaquinone biosynthesis C-methylase UbiE